MTKRALLSLSLAVGLSSSACGAREAAPPPMGFPVAFSAEGDDGAPLGGVLVAVAGESVTTDATGLARASLPGSEGETLAVRITCPAGFSMGAAPSPLRLSRARRLGASETEPLPYRVTCARTLRSVVVVVRAQNGGGVPVRIDGEAVGVTAPDGTAHFLLERDREVRSLNVSLDTRARRDLRPESPSRTFDLSGRDAVVLLDQPLSPVAAAPVRRTAPVRHVPYRID